MKIKYEKNMLFKFLRIFRISTSNILDSLVICIIALISIKLVIFITPKLLSLLKIIPTGLYLWALFLVLYSSYIDQETSLKKDIIFLGLFLYTTLVLYLYDWHIFIFKHLQWFISF